MHIGKQFELLEYVIWTRREILFLLLIASIPAVLYMLFEWKFLVKLPYFVSTILGTATAFFIAFKNRTALTRWNDALRLYGEILSISNNIGFKLESGLSSQPEKIRRMIQTKLVNQHLAWLTALRYRLRQKELWENLDEFGNKKFKEAFYVIPEQEVSLETAIKPFLNEKEIKIFLSRNKDPLYCLELQVAFLTELLGKYAVEQPFVDGMLRYIEQLNEKQTECLRIKTIPFLRNFSSITSHLLLIFLLVLPFALLPELIEKIMPLAVIPVSGLIGWVFICLNKVGQNTINPFEGGVNDVPITAMSIDIEITLKEMLALPDVPEKFKPMSGFILL